MVKCLTHHGAVCGLNRPDGRNIITDILQAARMQKKKKVGSGGSHLQLSSVL